MTDPVQRYIAGCDRYLAHATEVMHMSLFAAMGAWSNLPNQDRESWVEGKTDLIVAEATNEPMPAIRPISGHRMYLRHALSRASAVNYMDAVSVWRSMSVDEKKQWNQSAKNYENNRLIKDVL